MSKLNQKKSSTLTAALLGRIGNARANLSTVITKELADNVASLESASVAAFTDVENANGRVGATLLDAAKEAAEEAGGEGSEMIQNVTENEAGLEAASIVMMASGNLKGSYLRQQREQNNALKTNTDFSLEGFSVPGMNYSGSKSLESFGEADVDSHTSMSVAYNFCAPQQDEFASLFYPAVVGTPDQVYWRIAARRPAVTYGAQHDANAAATKYQKTNLLDAFRDHTVLENEDTRIVPFANPNGSNDSVLFDEAAFAITKKVRGVEVPTKPFAFNDVVADSIDLKGVASHPDLVKAGLLTQVDKIDTGARLSYLVMKISDDATPANVSYVKINTEHVMHNQFNQVREGLVEQTELRFTQPDYVIDTVSLTDSAGAAIPALAAAKAAGLSVYLPLRVDAELHLETGELSATRRAIKKGAMIDAAGAEVTSSALDNVTFELVAFDINARFTNAGRRVISLLLDSDELVRNYYVPTLAPISLQRPVTDETMRQDTEDLLTATHAWMSNMAVTSMLNHAKALQHLYNESVRQATNGRTPDWRGSSFRGVGGLFMAPFFEKVEVDLQEVVNSITSKDKLADIRGFFVGLINEISYRMVTESGYLPALRAFTGDNQAKPKLLIGTDIYLPAFMFIAGDDRLTGPKMDYEIAQSLDNRMANKIFLSLGGHGKQNDINVLTHGNMLYIPELVATVPFLRNGNTVSETMVQPRFFFVEHIPVLAEIEVKNVKAVIANRVKLDINTYAQA